MSIANTAATAGAGPSAAISAEPGRHVAWRPAATSTLRAAWTRMGSGPNRAVYSSGVTVRPDATSLASSSPWLTLRPRLSSMWVAMPDGPSFAACLIAVARGGGVAVTLRTGAAVLAVWGELQPVRPRIATAASAPTTRILTGR